MALQIGRAVTGVYNKVMNFRHLDPQDLRAGLSGAGSIDRKVWAEYYDVAAKRIDVARLDAEYMRRWVTTRVKEQVPDVPPAAPRRHPRVQGYEPDPEIRLAVEKWAMACAEAHYRGLGFSVENTARTRPYDLRCTLGDVEIRVEVKGSRGDANEVEVTIGEVENARGAQWRTDLFVVSRIEIVHGDAGPVAARGMCKVVEGWRADPADLTPTRFRCRVPG